MPTIQHWNTVSVSWFAWFVEKFLQRINAIGCTFVFSPRKLGQCCIWTVAVRSHYLTTSLRIVYGSLQFCLCLVECSQVDFQLDPDALWLLSSFEESDDSVEVILCWRSYPAVNLMENSCGRCNWGEYETSLYLKVMWHREQAPRGMRRLIMSN